MRETDRVAARVRTLLAGPGPQSHEADGADEVIAPVGGGSLRFDEVLEAGYVGRADDAAGEAAAGVADGWRASGGGRWRRLAARAPLRLDPGRRSALGVGVAVLVAALLAGGWLMLQRPQAAPVSARAPSMSITATPQGSGAPVRAARPSSSASSAASGGTQVVVDVAGKVHRPGLYRLPAGARIDDAVRSAGGPLPHVDLSSLNLASRLVDGQQILVGLPASAGPVGGGGGDGVGGTGAAPSGGSAGGSAGATGPVDLNTASLAQLDALPGVGPVLAQHILDWRTAHGSFTGVDQLNDVSGIGDVKFAALRPLVTV